MIALNRVGTPGMIVGLVLSISFIGVVEHEAGHDDHLGRPLDAVVHHHRHREHVEEGQDGHHPLLALLQVRRPGRHLLCVDRQIGVGQHRPLGCARRATRILKDGDVARIDGDGLRLPPLSRDALSRNDTLPQPGTIHPCQIASP